MKVFELSNEQNKEGLKAFTLVLHEIYDESTFDDVTKVANKVNRNGLGWREKWVRKNMNTIVGKFIRCEFMNEERSQMNAHGMSGYGADNMPLFEDATTVGYFSDVEIAEITDDEGATKKVLIGKGYIDALCYPALVNRLEHDLCTGEAIMGSVEILKTADNESIIYEYGYHDDQRIPMEYVYSGYAWLDCVPADDQAVLIELNNKKEDSPVDMTEVKDIIAEVMNAQAEIAKCKDECEAKVTEANESVITITAERDEAVAASEKVQTALDDCKAELEDTYKKLDALYEEIQALKDELGKAKARERIGEMNAAIADFTAAEKDYAKAEIDAFNADPMACEINSVVSKIYEGIGKAARESTVVSEQNAAKDMDINDIFGEVMEVTETDESIF